MNWQGDSNHAIDIVLATYNGEKYIEEQIHSLQRNDGYDFLVSNIIIVDDGSRDSTLSKLHDLAINDNKIKIYPSVGTPLGPTQNFCRGASLSTAKFVMFCDQDDVWLKDKLATTLDAMGEDDCSHPKLVFSDLLVVNDELEVIANSYFSLKNIPKNWHTNIGSLIKQNVASGCTMMANRALLDRALPVPEEAYMHDWWLALVAKVEGELIYVDQPLMLYRQHTNNAIGAGLHRKYDVHYRVNRFVQSVDKTVLQAGALVRKYPLIAEQHPEVKALSGIHARSWWKSMFAALFGNLRRSSLTGSLAMVMYCLFYAKNVEERTRERASTCS
ncbi:alpha-L-Rha alpha-1,3-L-rhamnosyltransferase [Enterovibrio norvegicus FF-454]|uniref:Alpha-L-Rha alpha-1,3-L-rhamnosyltransferase n=1 Tax=Enterovibrio norvegicus FF-454 TaxID=1185651 RepID=A0A1E5C0W2_9GAMM|nr:glycosyltransferase family 2 protein [Enterovibrio norvegicus]OEE58782.1 alpha-L-Rha alpha-1,3-L-rhamnosyltransferase [Enterovibrio norvegicus FF-454]